MSAHVEPLVRIVDDDASLLRALTRRLESEGFRIAPFPSVAAFLADRHPDDPGCLVLDLQLPGESGLELQDELRRTGDALPIVFLTGHGDLSSSVRAMKRGAVDFLTKPVDGETLVAAVREAIDRDLDTRAARRQRAEIQARYDMLTTRERQVFALIARGLLNKQAAYELGTSERTIKAHRARIMAKMGASSIADLARAADRLGIGAPAR